MTGGYEALPKVFHSESEAAAVFGAYRERGFRAELPRTTCPRRREYHDIADQRHVVLRPGPLVSE